MPASPKNTGTWGVTDTIGKFGILRLTLDIKDFQRESKSETLRETLSRFYIGLGYLVKLNLMVHVKVILTFSLLFYPWVKRCKCTIGLTFKVKVTEIFK